MAGTGVFIIHRGHVFNEGLKRILEETSDLTYIGSTNNVTNWYEYMPDRIPDIVLLDIDLPKTKVTEIVSKVRACWSNTFIVILTCVDKEDYVQECLKLDVDGYLSEETPISELLDSLRLITKGEKVYDARITSCISRIISGDRNQTSQELLLHNREMQVLRLAAVGLTNGQISRDLNISEHTVSSHLFNIYRKLGVESRTQAVLYGLKNGWYSVENLPSSK